MYSNYETIGLLVKDYNDYANTKNANGQTPVSFIKFALGQY